MIYSNKGFEFDAGYYSYVILLVLFFFSKSLVFVD